MQILGELSMTKQCVSYSFLSAHTAWEQGQIKHLSMALKVFQKKVLVNPIYWSLLY